MGIANWESAVSDDDMMEVVDFCVMGGENRRRKLRHHDPSLCRKP